MFYVDKTTVPRYWWACPGIVEERVGESLGNEGEFLSEESAVTYADCSMSDRLNRELLNIKNRYSRMYLAICRIRALWNSQIRAGLERHYRKRSDAVINAMFPPVTKIKYAPDQIPMQGTRLALGTLVYMVDNYANTLRVGKIDSERIRYYDFHPEGVAAHYNLDNKMSIDSTLKSTYSNQEIYLDKEQAIARMRELLQQQAEKINKQLETL